MDNLMTNKPGVSTERTWGDWAKSQASAAWATTESVVTDKKVVMGTGIALMAAGAFIGRGKIAEVAERILPKAADILGNEGELSVSARAGQWLAKVRGAGTTGDGFLVKESESYGGKIGSTNLTEARGNLEVKLHDEGAGGGTAPVDEGFHFSGPAGGSAPPDISFHDPTPAGISEPIETDQFHTTTYYFDSVGSGAHATEAIAGTEDPSAWTLRDGQRKIAMTGEDSRAYNEIMEHYRYKYPEAKIHPDALVDVPQENLGKTIIKQGAQITGKAKLADNVIVGEESVVSGNAVVGRHTVIGKGVTIKNYATIGEFSKIDDGATLQNYAKVGGLAKIGEGAVLKDHIVVGKSLEIGPRAELSGNATLGDKVIVGNEAHVIENARVQNESELGAKSVVSGTSNLGERTRVEDGLALQDFETSRTGQFVYRDTVSGATRSRNFW